MTVIGYIILVPVFMVLFIMVLIVLGGFAIGIVEFIYESCSK